MTCSLILYICAPIQLPFRRRKNINFFSKFSSVNINKCNHLDGIEREREREKKGTHIVNVTVRCECVTACAFPWSRVIDGDAVDRLKCSQNEKWMNWKKSAVQKYEFKKCLPCRLPGCRFLAFRLASICILLHVFELRVQIRPSGGKWKEENSLVFKSTSIAFSIHSAV